MSVVAMKPVDRTGWNDDLSVGIPEIDEDHRRFIGLINDLDRALNMRKDKPEIQRLMNLIIEDAVQHFQHEEQLFAKFGYPDARYHAGMHDQIVGELMKIKRQFDTLNFGVEWVGKGIEIRDLLIDHLLENDIKYCDFLRNAIAGQSLQGSGAGS